MGDSSFTWGIGMDVASYSNKASRTTEATAAVLLGAVDPNEAYRIDLP